jgi:F-type H+-transporting ATPase subunit a
LLLFYPAHSATLGSWLPRAPASVIGRAESFEKMKRLCRLLLLLATLAITVGAPFAARAAETEELPLSAPVLLKVGPVPVTNSMVVTWIVAIGIIVFAQVATRNMKEVPDGEQNFVEWLVEMLYNFLESIIGHQLVKKTFWFFATIFILILFSNWFGLLPGVGTIGFGTPTGPWLSIDKVSEPLFRGANADFNMTFAMAMVFFLMWIIWALQANGFAGFMLHLFAPKGEAKGAMKVFLIVLFIAAGFIEIISILFRPISLSFRLFGNMYAGEKMLEVMAELVPHPAWLHFLCSILIPIPFYFMEVMVGLVQALVFMLLTAVFTMMICEQHDEGHGVHPH